MRLMKSVARRVALNLSEAKRYTTLNEVPFGVSPVGSTNYKWVYKNVFAPLPSANGVTAGSSWAIDGNEIVDPLVKLKITWRLNYASIISSSPAYSSQYVYVYLIACNEQVSATVPPSNTWTTYPIQYSSDDPGWFLQQLGTRPTLNGNNVKVLRKWSRKYTPDEMYVPADAVIFGIGQPTLNMNCKHKFRGKKTFEDQVFADTDSNFLRSAILRGWNYYWLMGWATGGASLAPAQQPVAGVDSFTYFKDP